MQVLINKERGYVAPAVLLSSRKEKRGDTGTISPYPSEYITPHARYEQLGTVSHKGPPFKEGGPFFHKKFSITRTVFPINVTVEWNQPGAANNPWRNEWRGSISTWGTHPNGSGYGPIISESLVKAGFDSSSTIASVDLSDLETYGATAVARFSPLNPGANLAQTLGELANDGIPLLGQAASLFKRLKFLRGLGDAYLNAAFGWAPLLNDIRDLYAQHKAMDSRIRQIIRDNGKGIRRRGTIDSDQSSSLDIPISIAGNTIYMGEYGSGGWEADNVEPGITVRSKFSERIWFSGRFRYYIPFDDKPEWLWTKDAVRALYGANVTPEVLWNLLPWSWLVDWFANVGDVVHNLSSNGLADLLMDYGYLMRRRSNETTYEFGQPGTIKFNPYANETGRDVSIPSRREIILEETKERVAASPYGFGVHLDSLSARQVAILTALGFTRQNFA